MRKEERNRGSVRVKLIWGTGNGENLSGCTVDPWLQLNWTQETGPLGRGEGGRGGERVEGRKEGYGHAPRKKRILIGGNLSSPREGGIPRDRAGYLTSPE